MVKRCKNLSAAKRPPPARGNPCVTPRAARLADRRPRILERLTTRLTVAHILARAEELSAQRTRRIIAEMLAIDPPAGFFVHSQIARISVARTGERTMMREADLAAMDRIVRPTGELDPCRRVAPTRSPRRRRGTKRRSKPRGNFSCLQILEKPQNGIGISHGSVCDPAAPRAWRLHTFSRPGHSDIRATGRPTKTVRGMSSTPLIELTVEFDRYFGFARARLPADRTGIGESRLPRARLGERGALERENLSSLQSLEKSQNAKGIPKLLPEASSRKYPLCNPMRRFVESRPRRRAPPIWPNRQIGLCRARDSARGNECR